MVQPRPRESSFADRDGVTEVETLRSWAGMVEGGHRQVKHVARVVLSARHQKFQPVAIVVVDGFPYAACSECPARDSRARADGEDAEQRNPTEYTAARRSLNGDGMPAEERPDMSLDRARFIGPDGHRRSTGSPEMDR